MPVVTVEDFEAWGVLHFRDSSDEGIGYTCYYNYSPQNVPNTNGTPLLLGFARCNEKTYNKRIGKELAESRIQPHFIPIDMLRQIRNKKSLLSYIKDYVIGFIIPRYETCKTKPEKQFSKEGLYYGEMYSQKGVWYRKERTAWRENEDRYANECAENIMCNF